MDPKDAPSGDTYTPKPGPDEQFILVTGNPVDGFNYTGPFPTSEAAMREGEGADGDWWIARLWQPAEDQSEDSNED
jgi:hypothetical protein